MSARRLSRRPPGKMPMTAYITHEQHQRLQACSGRTGVPIAEYVRQGIDLMLRAKRREVK